MKATKVLAYAGDTIPYLAGETLIELRCVRPGESYRVSALYPSTGFEIPGLCASYRRETEARSVARAMALIFRSGASVVTALDTLGVIA